MSQEQLSSPQEGSSLARVQRKLYEKAHGLEHINKRASEIKSIVDSFRSNPIQAEERLTKEYRQFQALNGNRNPENQAQLENTIAGYLLYKLVESPNGKKFELRDNQIRGIAALLEKAHLHSRPNTGKSRVTLPIATIAKAITEGGTVASVTVSPELTRKLGENIASVNNYLPQEMRVTIDKCKETKPPGTKTDKLVADLARSVVEGEDDESIKTRHFNAIASYRKGQEHYQLEEQYRASEKSPRIALFSEEQFVFWKVSHEDKDFTHTYFDEIHVPRDRNNPYYIAGSGFPTKVSVEEYLFKRILSGVIAKKVKDYERQGKIVKKEGHYDFALSENGAEESTEVQNKLSGQFYDELERIGTGDSTEPLKEEVRLISQAYEVDQQKLDRWFKNYFSKSFANSGESEVRDELHSCTMSLLSARQIEEGAEYTGTSATLMPRDHYMGIDLPSREYDPDVAIALQAIHNNVDYIDFSKTAAQTTTFEGFVAWYLKGKLSGLSGTLLTPSLTSAALRKSPLAEFLEKVTGKPVYTDETTLSRFIPEPRYIESHSDKIQAIISEVDLTKGRVLIGTFNENEGLSLYKTLHEKYGDERPVILISSDIQDEAEIQKRYANFADLENAIIVSTGRTGVGADIVDSSGDHPFFKTIVDGIPYSTIQLYQLLERLRLEPTNPSEDFKWFFDSTQLETYPGFTYRDNGEKDKKLKKLKDLYDPGLDSGHRFVSLKDILYLSDGERKEVLRVKRLRFIEQFINRAEARLTEDDRQRIFFDHLYEASRGAFEDKIRQEREKPQGYYEETVEKRFKDDELVVLNHLFSTLADARPTLPPMTKKEAYQFKRVLLGLLNRKVERLVKSGDILATDNGYEFNPLGSDGKPNKRRLEARKKTIMQLIDRPLERYEIEQYLMPEIAAMNLPENYKDWFVEYWNLIRDQQKTTTYFDEIVHNLFRARAGKKDIVPTRRYSQQEIARQAIAGTYGFVEEPDWRQEHMPGKPYLKDAFYRRVETPERLYHMLRRIMSDTPQANDDKNPFYQEFIRRVDNYLNDPDLLRDWLSIRADEFVELMSNAIKHLRVSYPGAESLPDQLQQGKARFIIFGLGVPIEVAVPQRGAGYEENYIEETGLRAFFRASGNVVQPVLVYDEKTPARYNKGTKQYERVSTILSLSPSENFFPVAQIDKTRYIGVVRK